MKIILIILLSALLLSVAAPALAEEPSLPPGMKMYYLVLLYRGPNATTGDSPEKRQIQEAHIANIQRLADEGKMILAGPFADNGELRGLFLLEAASLKEAEELCQTDPAIKAGRLKADIHPWLGPKGIRYEEMPKPQQ